MLGYESLCSNTLKKKKYDYKLKKKKNYFILETAFIIIRKQMNLAKFTLHTS